jgi:hypothetical protein
VVVATVDLWEKLNDKVDRHYLLCLSHCNIGTSDDARAYIFAGRRHHPSRFGLRPRHDKGERCVRGQSRRSPDPQVYPMDWEHLRCVGKLSATIQHQRTCWSSS